MSVIIGGGDTGADCLGTSQTDKARKSVTSIGDHAASRRKTRVSR